MLFDQVLSRANATIDRRAFVGLQGRCRDVAVNACRRKNNEAAIDDDVAPHLSGNDGFGAEDVAANRAVVHEDEHSIIDPEVYIAGNGTGDLDAVLKAKIAGNFFTRGDDGLDVLCTNVDRLCQAGGPGA